MWKIRSPKGGKARILVGHGLDNELDRLQVEYPAAMIRYKSFITHAQAAFFF